MTLRGSTGSATGRSQMANTVLASPNERYARNALILFSSLVLVGTMMLIVPESTNAFSQAFRFACIAGVLGLSCFFRKRAFYDWQRRNEAMEDERDQAILASGNRAFRISASCWTVVLAAAVTVGSPQLPMLSGARLGGVMLVGLMVANLAGHAMVLWRYRQQRQ